MKKKKYGLADYILIPLKLTPVSTSIFFINKIIVALYPALSVLIFASLIDTSIGIAQGNLAFNAIYWPAILLLALNVYSFTITSLTNIFETMLYHNMDLKYRPILAQKLSKLKYHLIEDGESYDLINRVKNEPVGKIYMGMIHIFDFLSFVINVVSVVIIIAASVWWAALLIITISLPLVFVAVKTGKNNFDAFKKANKNFRRAGYYDRVLVDREFSEERAVFAFNKRIMNYWDKEYLEAYNLFKKASIPNHIKNLASSTITAILGFLIAGVFLIPLAAGSMTIGLFIGIITAVFALVQLMSWKMMNSIYHLTYYKGYMNDLTVFLKMEELKGAEGVPAIPEGFKFSSLEFKNVSFKYPKCENYILRNCSFKIDSRKRYAFVGENGAGKTTITKLIVQLFDDYEGEILLNGTDLKKYMPAEIKAIFSVLFQDFAKYCISVKENILLGRQGDFDSGKYYETLTAVNIHKLIDKLPDKENTALGRLDENSVDLSGGEWQKLAIARVLYKDSEVYILDEPTASLDPMQEKETYETFKDMTKNKTAIFITHRLGAIRFADEIFVVSEGKITECGNHQKLISEKGMYFNMFESQKEWYDL